MSKCALWKAMMSALSKAFLRAGLCSAVLVRVTGSIPTVDDLNVVPSYTPIAKVVHPFCRKRPVVSVSQASIHLSERKSHRVRVALSVGNDTFVLTLLARSSHRT